MMVRLLKKSWCCSGIAGRMNLSKRRMVSSGTFAFCWSCIGTCRELDFARYRVVPHVTLEALEIALSFQELCGFRCSEVTVSSWKV